MGFHTVPAFRVKGKNTMFCKGYQDNIRLYFLINRVWAKIASQIRIKQCCLINNVWKTILSPGYRKDRIHPWPREGWFVQFFIQDFKEKDAPSEAKSRQALCLCQTLVHLTWSPTPYTMEAGFSASDRFWQKPIFHRGEVNILEWIATFLRLQISAWRKKEIKKKS